MAVHIYTPAQVTIPARIENHVRVIGGEVWDFSRIALVTPVVVARGATHHPRAATAPVGHSGRCRCFEIVFEPGAATLSDAMKWRLLELPRDRSIWVAAAASPLAHMRAQAVSAFLLSHGRRPVSRRLYRDGAGNQVFVLTGGR